MNFKLTNLSAINQKYGKTMEQLKARFGKYAQTVADAQVIAVLTGCAVKRFQHQAN